MLLTNRYNPVRRVYYIHPLSNITGQHYEIAEKKPV